MQILDGGWPLLGATPTQIQTQIPDKLIPDFINYRSYYMKARGFKWRWALNGGWPLLGVRLAQHEEKIINLLFYILYIIFI